MSLFFISQALMFITVGLLFVLGIALADFQRRRHYSKMTESPKIEAYSDDETRAPE